MNQNNKEYKFILKLSKSNDSELVEFDEDTNFNFMIIENNLCISYSGPNIRKEYFLIEIFKKRFTFGFSNYLNSFILKLNSDDL
ncbi:hypothetical protein HERIO_2120 [Hepatospora eriocheir]|nr:hypothetical protein HERIO_2120 [Hepatospora eriocheir]